MGLGERAKPSNSSVSTTRIRPLSGPHWPWMLLQALSALRSGPRLQHLVQLHIRTDCGPQGHQLKNPSTTVPAQFARLQLSQWDRHRGTQCASVRWSAKKYHTSTAPPLYWSSLVVEVVRHNSQHAPPSSPVRRTQMQQPAHRHCETAQCSDTPSVPCACIPLSSRSLRASRPAQ